MRIISVDCTSILLTGITLSSSFCIGNPHETLAVMYELETKPDCFEVEPMRGMILHSQQKTVKIRIKPKERSNADRIQKGQNTLLIRATYFCEYNKKLLETLKMQGWKSISKQYQETILAINMSFEQQISKLKHSMRSGSSLKGSRKQNSFEKFRDSSVKKVKNSKLNEDLEFLFRNEEYGRSVRRNEKNSSNSPKPTSYTPKIPVSINLNASPFNRSNKELFQKTNAIKRQENQISDFGKKESFDQFVGGPLAPPNNANQTFELIILAIIAALSLVIGEGFGNVLRN